MLRIIPVAVAVALLGACSSMDHMFSRNDNATSSGGTSTGASGNDPYHWRSSKDMASTPPAYGVNTPPSDPGARLNAAPGSGCPQPGAGGDVKCQSPDPSGYR